MMNSESTEAINVNDTVTVLDGTRRFDVIRIENMGAGAIDGPLAKIWPWDDGEPLWASLALLRKVDNPNAGLGCGKLIDSMICALPLNHDGGCDPEPPVTVAPATLRGYALPPRPALDESAS